MKTLHPGDVVDIGRQQAQEWLLKEYATQPAWLSSAEFLSPDDLKNVAGIVSTATQDHVRGFLGHQSNLLPFEQSEWPAIKYPKTIWLDQINVIKFAYILIGLALLDTWEIALPLMDYGTLACSIQTTDTDRAYTAQVIRDLRVPLYDTWLMFLRDCQNTKNLLKTYQAERSLGNGSDHLAFLRWRPRVRRHPERPLAQLSVRGELRAPLARKPALVWVGQDTSPVLQSADAGAPPARGRPRAHVLGLDIPLAVAVRHQAPQRARRGRGADGVRSTSRWARSLPSRDGGGRWPSSARSGADEPGMAAMRVPGSLRVVIPAAGRGSRSGMRLPKTLRTVDGVPILVRILDAVREFDPRPVVVVSPDGRAAISDALLEAGRDAELVVQEATARDGAEAK